MIKNKDLLVFLMAKFNVNSPEKITQEMMDKVSRLTITTGNDPFLDNDPELYLDTCITKSFTDFHDLDGFKNLETLILSGLKPRSMFHMPHSIKKLYILNCHDFIVRIKGKDYYINKQITFGWETARGQKNK